MARASQPVRVEHVVSAGGVVYRRGRHGIEVVLCGRRGDGVWSLPKGGPERGESLERAALREVGEETGLRVSVREPLGSIRYQFTRGEGSVRFHKKVYHFLMRVSGGSVEDHDEEYDRVQWFAAEEALRLLTFPSEAEVVKSALRRLEGDSGETS
jgi:8-oxo-dGTP pyrophosphatase MutT (NUDIX family)